MPKELWPKLHVNYESRTHDWTDTLPKFIGFPSEGKPCDNEGHVLVKKEEEAAPKKE